MRRRLVGVAWQNYKHPVSWPVPTMGLPFSLLGASGWGAACTQTALVGAVMMLCSE